MGLISNIKERLQHSGSKADTSDELDEPLEQQLIDAQAYLARLRELPLSAFAEKSHKAMRMTPFGPTTYSVDNKDDAIARAKADVVELKVRLNVLL